MDKPCKIDYANEVGSSNLGKGIIGRGLETFGARRPENINNHNIMISL